MRKKNERTEQVSEMDKKAGKPAKAADAEASAAPSAEADAEAGIQKADESDGMAGDVDTDLPQAHPEVGAAEEETDVEALKEALNDAKAEIEAQREQGLRLMAEYENYRRRSRQEKEQLYTTSVSDVCSAWLPVLDNLERAVAAFRSLEGEEAQKAAEGVELVLRQAEGVLKKLGVEEIPAEGLAFDPEVHDAVLHVADADRSESEIVEVLQKGYRRGERVLRHSTVKVAN